MLLNKFARHGAERFLRRNNPGFDFLTKPSRNLTSSLLTVISFTLLPSSAFAFFCPTNFNQINFGDTIDQVKQACGNPAKEETKDVTKNVPQEWSYYIPQSVGMGGTYTQAQGTLKTSITFDKDDKAVNISVNGIGVGATTICGQNIQLGDSQETVKSACGEPSFINKEQPRAPTTDTTTAPAVADKITEFTYTSNPPTVLVFESGVLTSKK